MESLLVKEDMIHQLQILKELTGQLSSPHGVVPLPLIKLCRHRDDSFLDGHSELLLDHLLHLQQQPGTDELWAHRERVVGGNKKFCTSIVVNHLGVKKGKMRL